MKDNKKELINDFRKVYRKQREVVISMIALFIMNVVLFLTPIFNLNATLPKIRVRFSDVYDKVFDQAGWYYLLTFSLLAVIIGLGHNFIAARIASRQGKHLALIFLALSMLLTAFAICFLFKILSEPN